MNDLIEFHDGNNAAPQAVHVLIFHNKLHAYTVAADKNQLLFSCPLKSLRAGKEADNDLLHLDATGNRYLRYPHDTPFARLVQAELQSLPVSHFNGIVRHPAIKWAGVCLVLFAALYALLTLIMPAICLRAIRPAQEAALGNTMAAGILSGEHIDTAGTKLVQSFANHLQLSGNYPITTTVVKQPVVNAFALPGGHIVVYSGLLQQLRSAEELAALLAHEATHINERHSLRSVLNNVSYSVLIQVLTGNAPAIADALAQNAGYLQSLSYSRKLEKEADAKGMQLLLRNQVSPEGMVALLQQLQQQETTRQISFLSTHPLTAQRLAAAQRFIHHNDIAEYKTNKELAAIWNSIAHR
ncbi:M48 family metallopeptidase [Deminuibacter soli]|nr:M48 family metallopeptidase [Deminuibacter soli]